MQYLFALLSAIFAALVTIFAKIGLKNIDSTLATTIRSIIMAVFLTVTVLIFNKVKIEDLKTIEGKELGFIVVSGIAGALSWIFYFIALQQSKDNTTQIAALDKLSLVFILILSVVFLGDKIDPKVIAGVVLMVIGAILTII